MKFLEKDLINSYYNAEDNTADLEFYIDGKTVWIRRAPFMEDAEIDEWYWTDETIQYALENGGEVEEA